VLTRSAKGNAARHPASNQRRDQDWKHQEETEKRGISQIESRSAAQNDAGVFEVTFRDE
jgi:hypothetical protein